MHAKSAIRIWLTVLACQFCCSIHSQKTLSYKFDHYSPESGLSSIFSRKIIQDPLGFMWIGTQDGLNRFDGVHFDTYNRSGPFRRQISGSDIRDLVIDSARHLLWVTSSYGGIDAIDYISGTVVIRFAQNHHPALQSILFTRLAIEEGQLLVGSVAGLYILDSLGNTMQRQTLPFQMYEGGKSPIIDMMIAMPNGCRMLLLRNKGIFLLDKRYRLIDQVSADDVSGQPNTSIQFYDAVAINNYSWCLATSMGAYTITVNMQNNISLNTLPFASVTLTQNRPVYACSKDRTGNLWFATPNYLIKLDFATKQYVIIKENLSKDAWEWIKAVYCLYFDQSNNLWLGCQQGLAYMENRPSPFIVYFRSPDSESAIRHAYYIWPANDSTVYVCAQDGLYRTNLHNGHITTIDHTQPYYHILQLPSGVFLVGTLKGTFSLIQGKYSPVSRQFPAFRGHDDFVLNSHCSIGDSIIVLGSENYKGVLLWNIRNQTLEQINTSSKKLPVRENYINSLYKDHQGKVWILGDSSISIYNPELKQVKALDLLHPTLKTRFSIFFDILQVKDQYYLASYGGGVIILDAQFNVTNNLTVAEGLSSNSVYKLLPYKDSLLFVTSNKGISVVNINTPNSVFTLDRSDGMQSNTFEEMSGAYMNNIIFAGGVDGFTKIDPASFSRQRIAPPIYLKELKIITASGNIDTSNLLETSYTIPAGVQQVTLTFSALDYSNVSKMQYAYKIIELQNDWVNLGSQNFIDLVGLPPGKYNILINAAVGKDSMNLTTLAIRLYLLPKWYQTLTFKLTILLIALAIFYGAYRYRIRQIQVQQNIRRNIASDLHDDIGSTLNSIKIYSHLARKEQSSEYLSQIENSVKEASMSLRDIIWVLDDSRDSVYELMERIKRFASPACLASGISLQCQVEAGENSRPVSKEEKKNLLLIAKEAVNNCIKYADCTTISLSLLQSGKKVVLNIHDNGIGFQPGIKTDGNGLKNMQTRAQQIHYHLHITSSKTGTQISLTNRL